MVLTASVGIPLAYLMAAFTLGIFPEGGSDFTCEGKNEYIYLQSNGKHVDLVLEIGSVDKGIANRIPELNSTEFLAFGWGDLAFYTETPTWSEFNPATALKAIFCRGETVIHVVKQKSLGNEAVSIPVCKQQLDLLNNHLLAQFRKDELGNPLRALDFSYGDSDYFFSARGNFSPFLTCNEWINRWLKYAGIDSPIWSPFPQTLMSYHKEE